MCFVHDDVLQPVRVLFVEFEIETTYLFTLALIYPESKFPTEDLLYKPSGFYLLDIQGGLSPNGTRAVEDLSMARHVL